MYERYVKRILDIMMSLCMLIVASPVMAVTALLVRIKLGKPILFRQERAGFREAPFEMYKFRSMRDDRDADGVLLSDEERITPLGTKIRALSIDELPGLFNVLRGEMSLIGPRPLPTEFLPYYDDFQRQRHMVKPGIVGLASVRGRNNQSWDSKFKNDVEYVHTLSFRTDLKILLKAVKVVLSREDVNAEGYVSGAPFIADQVKETGESKR